MVTVKIVKKEEIERLLKKKACPLSLMGVIGNKKTGKIVEIHKIDPSTRKKTILYKNKKEFEIFNKKLREEK